MCKSVRELSQCLAENATLRAFIQDDAEHYRQMCEIVGADHDCMTGGHEHLVSYLADYAQDFAAATKERDELRRLLETIRDRIDPFAAKTQSDFDNLRQIQLDVLSAIQQGDNA